ncbi:YgaP family membrane protein [Roseibium aggregatum]|uniref:DUF2892 domain-containing protein n=1 Tax=Roseibium aggregatum TaxID=187304 RepID=A0A926NYI7_9HYPH|nr:DUF2892 domain-containing protein [Roseibium aggregatum]MBD1546646.1 DUF2892 domain-containing protein [Roseibium aggregatum]
MPLERIFTLIVGCMILASLALAIYHNINWLWFTAFIGANLIQFSFTGFCPLTIILKKVGFKTRGSIA